MLLLFPRVSLAEEGFGYGAGEPPTAKAGPALFDIIAQPVIKQFKKNPLLLGVGGGTIGIAAVAFFIYRRRKKKLDNSEETDEQA